MTSPPDFRKDAEARQVFEAMERVRVTETVSAWEGDYEPKLKMVAILAQALAKAYQLGEEAMRERRTDTSIVALRRRFIEARDAYARAFSGNPTEGISITTTEPKP